jgi:hypothetical protein
MDENEQRAAGRFFVGKFASSDILRVWFESGEDYSVLQGILPFIFVISPSDADALVPLATGSWTEILTKIRNNEKITQKMISVVISERKPVHQDSSSDELILDEPQDGFVSKH